MTYTRSGIAPVPGTWELRYAGCMTRRHSLAYALTAAAFLPALAYAHPGHAEHAGFTQGLAHPFSGIDHLLALAAVGILAGRLGGRAMFALLGAWMGLLIVGAAAGFAGIELPPVRPLLIVSIGVCALLAIVLPKAPPRYLAAGIIALASFFAFFHGFAHGERAIAASAGVGYLIGVAAASAFVLALAAAVTRSKIPLTANARR